MSINSYCRTDHTEPKDIKESQISMSFYYKAGLGAI